MKSPNENRKEKAENRIAAIVLAAGQGRRMHSAVAKQFLMLDGKPLIYYSLAAFENSTADTVILVTGEEEISYCRTKILETYGISKVKEIVAGGRERYHSVYAGLLALEDQGFPKDGIVLIQDGARPMLDAEMIERSVEGAVKFGACVAAMPVKDTIKIADTENFSDQTLKRSTLWQIQTPQAFSFSLILEAYRRLFSKEEYQNNITDDAMVVETMTNHKVKLVYGDYSNIKVTTPEDMAVAEVFLRLRKYKQI